MTLSGQGPPGDAAQTPGNDNRIAEELLQAYIDGQLPADQRVRIERYLASHPAELERLAAYHKQNIGLHALFDPRNDEAESGKLPASLVGLAKELEDQLSASKRPTPVLRARDLRALAAGLVLAVAAGTSGWLAHSQLSGPKDPLVAFTRQAVEAHSRLESDQASGTGAAASGHQVIAWLSEQSAGASLKLPDLESLGFRLVADRVMPTAAGKRAAQLLYQADDGQRVTLYMRAGAPRADEAAAEISFTFRREGPVSQFFWQYGPFAYSLIGMMEQERLLEIAEVISAELQGDVREAGGGNTDPAAPTPSTLSQGVEKSQVTQEVPQEPALEIEGAGGMPGNKPGENAPLEQPERLPLQPLPAPLPKSNGSAEET